MPRTLTESCQILVLSFYQKFTKHFCKIEILEYGFCFTMKRPLAFCADVLETKKYIKNFCLKTFFALFEFKVKTLGFILKFFSPFKFLLIGRLIFEQTCLTLEK